MQGLYFLAFLFLFLGGSLEVQAVEVEPLCTYQPSLKHPCEVEKISGCFLENRYQWFVYGYSCHDKIPSNQTFWGSKESGVHEVINLGSLYNVEGRETHPVENIYNQTPHQNYGEFCKNGSENGGALCIDREKMCHNLISKSRHLCRTPCEIKSLNVEIYAYPSFGELVLYKKGQTLPAGSRILEPDFSFVDQLQQYRQQGLIEDHIENQILSFASACGVK